MSTVRKDSWAGQLSLDDQAKIYETWRKFHGPFDEFADWIEKTFPDARRPARSPFYESIHAPSSENPHSGGLYRAWMQVRSEAIRNGGEQMVSWAKSAKIDNADLVEGLKNLGCNALSSGDLEAGRDLLQDFRDTARLMLEQQANDLKARAQATKEDQLKLAREKFEFDAAKRAMELAAEINTVAGDDSLDDDEKIQKVREALFG